MDPKGLGFGVIERATYFFNLKKLILLCQVKCNSEAIGIIKKNLFIRIGGNLGTK